ncbi:hypothetical protein [Levilactobacillus yonginensis]|uniref:hypothetical protein n=1 Tax=Levilactobacillus yonginensis TaxID=1054041 RepID=UPI00345D2878
MIVLASLFARTGVQFFVRCSIYVALLALVIIVRLVHRRSTRKKLDHLTKEMMKQTEKDDQGKYPWEYEDSKAHSWDNEETHTRR